MTGDPLITGGAFGFEGSIFCIMLSSVVIPKSPALSSNIPGECGANTSSAPPGTDPARTIVGSRSDKRPRQPDSRIPWSELLLRVFREDVLSCPCGGRRVVLAFITDKDVVEQ